MNVATREFIAGLGSAAAWPRAARAQQGVPTVGHLFVGARGLAFDYTADFRKGLGEMGFVEGRNLAIEYRYADFAYNRLPALATELVRRRVAAIWAAGGGSVASAAKAATSTIPIVFCIGDDPVEAGVVASFNRPGGNVTGITFISELTAKRFGLLHDLLPKAKHFAVLADAGNPRVEETIAVARVAASAIGGQIEVFAVANAGETFAGAARSPGMRRNGGRDRA